MWFCAVFLPASIVFTCEVFNDFKINRYFSEQIGLYFTKLLSYNDCSSNSRIDLLEEVAVREDMNVGKDVISDEKSSNLFVKVKIMHVFIQRYVYVYTTDLYIAKFFRKLVRNIRNFC